MKKELMVLMVATGLAVISIGGVEAATTGVGLGVHGGYGQSRLTRAKARRIKGSAASRSPRC